MKYSVLPLKECNRYCTRFSFKSQNLAQSITEQKQYLPKDRKLLSIIPNDNKNAPSLNIFKNKIKQLKPVDRPCRICKTYIAGVGFINIANYN